MARVSRNIKKEYKKIQVLYLVGLYLRLSSEDESENFIEYQSKLCLDYLEHEENIQIIDVYIDNGATGTNFHRPGFERMMSDLKAGRINCIIVKDLSRFGRNHLETSEYLEKIFPANGTRFIAVNNNYDSHKAGNEKEGIVIPFSNIVNEMYAKDISGKIRSSIHTLMDKGEFLPASGSIPYGYLRDKDSNSYRVDGETEDIVRMIFEMKIAGMSSCRIAAELNRKGIASPGKLRYLRGISHDKRHETSVWTHKTIQRMLEDEVYLGHRIHGKIKKDAIGEPKKKRSKDSWQYIYNAHTAIISEEVFLQVRNILEEERTVRKGYSHHKPTTREQQEILKDKVFCGDCGALMGPMKRNQRITSDLEPEIYYQCNNFVKSERVICSNHYISQRVLLEKIDNAVRVQIQLALDLEKFLQDVGKNNVLNGNNGKNQFKGIQQKQASYAARLEQLLIDYNSGVIDKEEYIYIKNKYNQAMEQLNIQHEQVRKEQDAKNKIVSQANQWIDMIKEYQSKGKLDRYLVECLIDRVNVYADRSVEIIFTFRDEAKEILTDLREQGEELSDEKTINGIFEAVVS